MYLIVLPEQKWFDIIISEQKFKFKTSLNNLVSDMQFTNSKENTPFYSYLNFINSKQKDIAPIREKLKNANGAENKELFVIGGYKSDTKTFNGIYKVDTKVDMNGAGAGGWKKVTPTLAENFNLEVLNRINLKILKVQ